MVLYLTGAQTTLKKGNAPQTDPYKSLGGYISTTPAPNNSPNSLFDAISSYTLANGAKESVALGLINNETDLHNVTLKIVSQDINVAKYKVAAVTLNNDFSMEQITSRYAEPQIGEFFDATFYRAFVDLEVLTPANPNEEIMIFPMGVTIKVEEGGINGTWNAFENAFENVEDWCVIRLSKNKFRIQRRDDAVYIEREETEEERSEEIENSTEETTQENNDEYYIQDCSYISTDSFKCKFLKRLDNGGKTNEVVLIDEMQSGTGIGLWIQRIVPKGKMISNEELLKQYKDNKDFVLQDENVEIVITSE